MLTSTCRLTFKEVNWQLKYVNIFITQIILTSIPTNMLLRKQVLWWILLYCKHFCFRVSTKSWTFFAVLLFAVADKDGLGWFVNVDITSRLWILIQCVTCSKEFSVIIFNWYLPQQPFTCWGSAWSPYSFKQLWVILTTTEWQSNMMTEIIFRP